MPMQDTPESLRSLFGEVEGAVHRAALILEEALPESRDHFRGAMAELDASLREAYKVVGDAELA